MNRRIDTWLIVPVVILLALGLLMVFSTTAISHDTSEGHATALLVRHILHMALGLLALICCYSLDPRLLYKISIPLMLFTFILLVAVLVPGIGHDAGGARRWLSIGPLRIQPGEIAKFVFILYLASYIDRHKQQMSGFLHGAVIPFFVVAAAGSLLLLEPDFGSTVILMSVVFFQLLTASRLSHLLGLGICGLVMLGTLAVTSPYRMRRITVFLDPFRDPSASGYQLIQSLIAVGSGGVAGQGLGAGKQKLFYLPAAHTDFIYAVIAEELGFIGALAVLVLFLIIAYRGVQIAKRLSVEPFLSSLALGVTLIIVLPALLNMGVVIGLFPTKGLVLPLVAYGGTAMIVHLAAFGVLLRLSRISP